MNVPDAFIEKNTKLVAIATHMLHLVNPSQLVNKNGLFGTNFYKLSVITFF